MTAQGLSIRKSLTVRSGTIDAANSITVENMGRPSDQHGPLEVTRRIGNNRIVISECASFDNIPGALSMGTNQQCHSSQ